MLDLIRNSALLAGVFVLTLMAWFIGGAYWGQAFLFGRTYESVLGFFAAAWGFDFLLTLTAGFVLTFLIRGKRRLLWIATLGLGFVLLRIRFSAHGASSPPDWTLYVGDYGRYLMPLVGALAGGFLARWLRGTRGSAAGA
jgi:hypothetical protein